MHAGAAYGIGKTVGVGSLEQVCYAIDVPCTPSTNVQAAWEVRSTRMSGGFRGTDNMWDLRFGAIPHSAKPIRKKQVKAVKRTSF